MMWEMIDSGSARLKVPGGWIVRSGIIGMGAGSAMAMVFISDPEHEWRIVK